MGSALLARVRSNPDQESWRVYVDWLLEQGDARGRLVQLGHRLETQVLSEEERALVQALEAAHQPSWRAGMEVPERARLFWRFGFVVGMTLTHWDIDRIEALEPLFAHPTARFLASLNLEDNGIGDEGAVALARSETLGSLTRLYLGGNRIGEEGRVDLARSEALRRCW